MLPSAKRAGFETVAGVVMLTVAATLAWATFVRKSDPPKAEPQVPVGRLSLEGRWTLGAPASPVAMVMFSDFECPFCKVFARKVWPELRIRFVETGTLAVVSRQLPLETIHPHAFEAAEAAECAGGQDRYWEMHEQLFEAAGTLDRANLVRVAGSLGLGLVNFEQCLAGTTAQQIRTDMALARDLGISGTPTFVLGLRDGLSLIPKAVIAGTGSIETFASKIEELSALAPRTVR